MVTTPLGKQKAVSLLWDTTRKNLRGDGGFNLHLDQVSRQGSEYEKTQTKHIETAIAQAALPVNPSAAAVTATELFETSPGANAEMQRRVREFMESKEKGEKGAVEIEPAGKQAA